MKNVWCECEAGEYEEGMKREKWYKSGMKGYEESMKRGVKRV